MESISSEIVEKTWKKLGKMSPLQIPKIAYRMRKEQPIILAYLLAAGHDTLNQDEREMLLYLGLVVWRIMSQGSRPLNEITENILNEMEISNVKMIEYLEAESEAGADAMKKIIDNYPQPEVLKYVVEALLEEQEEGCVIRDGNKGMMMLYLKTVIDCFSREQEGI